jgi:hypothetical protein
MQTSPLQLKENELAVFFRNNHFSVIFKVNYHAERKV